jgi:hypothetical protein
MGLLTLSGVMAVQAKLLMQTWLPAAFRQQLGTQKAAGHPASSVLADKARLMRLVQGMVGRGKGSSLGHLEHNKLRAPRHFCHPSSCLTPYTYTEADPRDFCSCQGFVHAVPSPHCLISSPPPIPLQRPS